MVRNDKISEYESPNEGTSALWRNVANQLLRGFFYNE